MIKQPNEMKFDDKRFSMIIYGSPGTGKTTLACSAPKPFLIDLDKGVSRVKAQHRVITSTIDKYEELEEDFKSDAFKNCETVIIDTGGALITYLQDYVMRKDGAVNKTKSGTISIKGFGAVKQEFINLTNKLKTIYNKNVIYVFHSQEEKDKDGNPNQRLLCEGSARNIVWQPCDFGCFIYMQNSGRVVGFTPTDEYFAKGCFGINGVRQIPTLKDTDKNDFLTRLFDEARANIAKESEFFDGQKTEYNKAMAQGAALVDGVTDIETVKTFGDKFKVIPHALTSEAEIRTMFNNKIATLGISWDREKKEWVKKEVKKEGE
jgi:hypothetical protein